MTSLMTNLIGCELPIQSVPVPGIATIDFVATICNNGALGMLPGSMLPADAVDDMLRKLAMKTPAPFGVNFLVPFLEPELEAVIAAADRARVVEFFYGDPDEALVNLVHAHGALCCWQVGSCDEAVAAEMAGCDLIVQQGVEAGGHVRGKTDLLPTLRDTLDVLNVPVIAAGGIATGADVQKIMATGAAGVRVGTRLVCSAESDAHPTYKQALVGALAKDTTYTETFSVMWPDAPHRVLQSAIDSAALKSEEVVGSWQFAGESMPIPRHAVIAPTTTTTGQIEAMALYAGHSVERISSVESVAAIIRDLASGL